jgi:hypothetical protein
MYKEIAVYEFNGMFSVVFVAEKVENQRLYFSSRDITKTYEKAFEAVQLLNRYRLNN